MCLVPNCVRRYCRTPPGRGPPDHTGHRRRSGTTAKWRTAHLRARVQAAMLTRPEESTTDSCKNMTSYSPQGDRSGSEQAVADVLRQLLAEERTRSDQLLEAMTAWQLRARLAEERLVALSGGSTPSSQGDRPRLESAAAARGPDRPPVPSASTQQPDVDRMALPPAPQGDPVFTRHPLYRGRRYRQLVEDFTNEANGAQRQYRALASKRDRTRRDEIALGLLDAEWAAIGGPEWPAADPRWLAERRARFEYRFETGRGRSPISGLTRALLFASLGVLLVAIATLLVLIVD